MLLLSGSGALAQGPTADVPAGPEAGPTHLAEATAPVGRVRVATWNIETVGHPGSAEYQAAVDILLRIGADVIAINEVASAADTENLFELAADAGYDTVVAPTSNPFGADRNAILSALPVTSWAIHTSADLSGDALANDLSRLLVEVTVEVPGDFLDLTVVSGHWKSGNGNDDEFRRAVESLRVAQTVAHLDPLFDTYVLVGDVNEETHDVPQTPALFTTTASGLPASWKLGTDLEGDLLLTGIENDPFANLSRTDVTTLAAPQLDGTDATRPASGRRLDYLFVSPALAIATGQGETYDANDESMGGGLPKFGEALPPVTTAIASDHLPVFADLDLPPRCGNGRLEDAEECDDDASNGGPGSCCAADCTHKSDGPASCDGNLCTRGDTCIDGECLAGPCASGQACSFCSGVCEIVAGDCSCSF